MCSELEHNVLWLDAETIDVCTWPKFVFRSVVVTVWGSGNACCVATVVML